MTYAAKVIAIPELLEQILFHVPLPDLMIRIQSVNRYFYIMITTSPLLQHKLFYSSTRNPFLYNHSNTIIPNPLFYPSFHAYVSSSRKVWITSPELRPLELAELGVGRRGMLRRGFRWSDASVLEGTFLKGPFDIHVLWEREMVKLLMERCERASLQ